jgi:hypothetical protein
MIKIRNKQKYKKRLEKGKSGKPKYRWRRKYRGMRKKD